jgi:hypothetical protein
MILFLFFITNTQTNFIILAKQIFTNVHKPWLVFFAQILSFALIPDKDPGLPRETQPDPKKGALFFEKACEADIGDACHRLSNMYINGFKETVEVILLHLLTNINQSSMSTMNTIVDKWSLFTFLKSFCVS